MHVLTKIFIVLVSLLAVLIVPLVVVYAHNEDSFKAKYEAAAALAAAANQNLESEALTHADEQAQRFEAREKTPYKKYKITDEDYRNRARWDDYVAAVNEMVARTSSELAPWRLVPANDKRYARVEVLRAVCEGLGRLTGEAE